MLLEKCLIAYVRGKSGRNLRTSSVLHYRRELARFVQYATADGVAKIDELQPLHIQAWLSEMLEAGLSATTVRQRRVTVLMWMNWLTRHGYIEPRAWGDEVEDIIIDEPEPHYLSPKEAALMLEVSKRMSPHKLLSVRQPAIIALLIDTGLRLGEIAGLSLEDVDLVGRYILVRNTAKGRSSRICPFGPETLRYLRAYLRERNRQGVDDRRFWAGRHGQGCSRRAIYDTVRRAGEMAGVRWPHPHALRHMCCTLLADSGMPIHLIAEQFGHKRLRTTQRYIHRTGTELRAQYDRFCPLTTIRNQ